MGDLGNSIRYQQRVVLGLVVAAPCHNTSENHSPICSKLIQQGLGKKGLSRFCGEVSAFYGADRCTHAAKRCHMSVFYLDVHHVASVPTKAKSFDKWGVSA